MKPFDLEKALKGAPVVTRDGREVTQLHLFSLEVSYSLFGVIQDKECGPRVECFTKNGEYRLNRKTDTDLFMKTVKKVGYVHPSTIKDTPLGDSWIKVEYEE